MGQYKYRILINGTLTVAYTDIEGGYTGTGNINSDPRFVSPGDGNYNIPNYSPAIGADATTGALSTDIEGKARPTPANTNPDMGAYENDLGSPKVITPIVESVFTNFQEKTYIIGESIDIKLKLSENVNVTGTPRLKLETGDVDSYANYISGSGNDTLLFRYIVSSGDTTSSLDYTGNDALELNGGTMIFIQAPLKQSLT